MNPDGVSSARFARQRGMGWDGLAMLLLSNLMLLATLGLSGLWQFQRVWRIARDALATVAEDGGWVVVLGLRLRGDRITLDYARRLQRAAILYEANPRRRLLLVGGRTGSAFSEAERGRQFLLECGVPADHLVIEDQSLNTLDNLRQARRLLTDGGQDSWVLVTQRYHLARALVLARGLGLQPRLCAAEERLRHDPRTLWRLVLEAYYLHWYDVGRIWSRWTRNRRSLARIT
jgi:uncharacterized SAM-binding protein YcdF (DUF218 family)